MLTSRRKKGLNDLAEAIAKNMTLSELDALIAFLEQSLKKPPKNEKGETRE